MSKNNFNKNGFYDKSKTNYNSFNNLEPATAPYNFVPLAKDNKVISFIPNNNEKKYSGKIEVTIENLSPIFIRNSKQNDENTQPDSNFYSPAEKYRIPGSSLRGLIRNIVEIVSFGYFSFFEDKYLYFRDFANQPLSSVYAKYNLSSVDNNKNITYEMKMGKLYKEGRKYRIESYGSPYRISNENLRNIFDEAGKTYNPTIWDFCEHNQVLYVSSTGLKNKVKNWAVSTKDKPIEVFYLSENDIFDYKNDKKREESPKVPNLFNLLKNKKYVPVFYIQWPDNKGINRTTIGHTGFFRLPYKSSIGEHIPTQRNSENNIDIATSIFGDEKRFAGKVYFEDCYLQIKQDQFENVTYMKPLLSPNPTSFQLYLENKSGSKPENLNHYNIKHAKIRGYKLYWHRNEPYTLNNINNKNISTKVMPVKKNNIFKGVINFNDLTEIELGALLFVLNLPGNLALKIGAGKPFNLGSIKISASLTLTPVDYLKDISKGWFGNNNNEERNINIFINNFKSFILKNIAPNLKDIWEIDRMKELKQILDYKNKPNDSNTEYMQVTDIRFRKRSVLPKPSEIKKN
jgi:hypothetical protein